MLKAVMGSNDDLAIKAGEPPDLHNPDLNELREILLGDNWRKIAALEKEILDHGNFSRRVAGVLPDSLREANDTPASLVGAMQDPTIESISIAARKEQERLSEALAPIIGPSIQRAIGQALQKFTQSIETIAQHNFSVKGLKWRIESARTGIPFHQVVLKHTLQYEVEQIYLIQKPSGLLVRHLMHPDLEEQTVDRDAIAGMMMAIQDFVRDSAFAQTSEQVQSIDMRGKTVWMCHGAWALLACVIEGRPPESLRGDMKAVLDTVHGRYQHELREFNGDLGELEHVDRPLSPLLQRELIDESGGRPGKSKFPWWVFGLIAAMTVWFLYALYAGYQNNEQRERLRAVLDHTPGVVLTSLEHIDGVWIARGMADPLAFDTAVTLAKAKFSGDQVKFELQPYVSLDPKLVLRRAEITLKPPKSLQVSLADASLLLKGFAEKDWIERTKAVNPATLNVARIDFSQVTVDYRTHLQRALEDLNATKFHFSERLNLISGVEGKLRVAADLLIRANNMAVETGGRLRVAIIGQADTSGPEQLNATLREERASLIKAKLINLGVPPQILDTLRGQEVNADAHLGRRADLNVDLR